MTETLLCPRNLAFELYEVLDAEALTRRARFADHSRETFDAALGTARGIAEKYFAPHNRTSDEHEPRYVDGEALLIPEVKPAVDAFVAAGFHNAQRSFEDGGMQLPNQDPTSAQVPIIEHTDVRRMLLAQKAYVEGAFDLGLYAARLVDDQHSAENEEQRRNAGELLDLLTPIVKSWPSEFCLKANELAIQVLGGHGYTREYPVEQYYRDNRLNPIHEGTHGIQSLDLLGRKLTQNRGAGLRQLLGLIQGSCRRAAEHDALSALREPLERHVARLAEVTQALLGDLGAGQFNQALANSALYLKVFGHAVIGWRWLEQALRAERGLAGGNPADADFYRGKLQAARYFLTWEVPGCAHELALLENRDDTCLAMQDAWF